MNPLLPVVALLILSLAGCTKPAPPLPELPSEEQAIRDLSARWHAYTKAGDRAGLASLVAQEAVIIRPKRDPFVGPAAVTALLDDDPKSVPSREAQSIIVAASGDAAVERGAFRITGLSINLPDGAGLVERDGVGNYITVYTKASGSWKVLNDVLWFTAWVAPLPGDGKQSSGQ